MAKFGDPTLLLQQRSHGTCDRGVDVDNLRFHGARYRSIDINCITCLNHKNWEGNLAEEQGSWEEFLMQRTPAPVTEFYDSIYSKPVFTLQRTEGARSYAEFWLESHEHGWPSFRDDEVEWDNVRVIEATGETVTLDGVHLGHCIPDEIGNRYCINVLSIAGNPSK
jgi:peptide methionine sulfoxide reductase MsrB